MVGDAAWVSVLGTEGNLLLRYNPFDLTACIRT
jgi:hypothetical protein